MEPTYEREYAPLASDRPLQPLGPGRAQRGGSASALAPSALPAVAESLVHLSNAVADLEEILGHLNQRLGPVLTPVPAQAATGGNFKDPSQSISHLIHHQAERVLILRGFVADLLSRLEI